MRAHGATTAPIVRGASLREQVRGTIEDLVVFGTLAPGEHLVEGVLAERLGVSRQPVREALQLLAGTGFIVLEPGRGAFVRTPTQREVREAFHVRAVLEADAAGQAALAIDEQGLADLDALVELGVGAAAGEDSRTLLELNTRFHDLVTDAGGNRVTRHYLDDLQRRIAWYLATIIVGRAPSSWLEHGEILAALHARDADHAAALTRAHVLRSLELLEFSAT